VTVRDIRHLLPLTAVAKSDWRRVRPGGPDDVTAIAIHYMGKEYFFPAEGATEQDEINQARMIHIYHLGIGYGGIGYNGLAFESGRSYYTADYNRWGAAVKGRNDSTLSFAGMFGGHVIPPRGIQDGLADLIGDADETYLADSERPVKGHRDFTRTSCPGDLWQQWVPGLRAAALQEGDMAMTPEQQAQLQRLILAEKDFRVVEKQVWEAIQSLQKRVDSLRDAARSQGPSEARMRAIAQEEDRKLKVTK